MNERQALEALRNQVRLLDLADDVADAVIPLLERAYRQVAARIRRLSPLSEGGTTLFRESRWRTLLAQLQVLLESPNDALRDRLIRDMAMAIPQQVKEAETLMRLAGLEPFQRADEFSPGLGEVTRQAGLQQAVTASLDAGPPISMATLAGAPITPTQLVRAAKGVDVLKASMDSLFNVLGVEDPRLPRNLPPSQREYGSAYIRRNIRIIDDVAKQGFLLGETNDEIARRLLDVGINRARSETSTIARTAVMQLADDAQAEFYRANSSVIAGWEFDASMDYKVCVLCAPWDGRTAERREDLPRLKVHPNCRCTVQPISRRELRRRQQSPKPVRVLELRPYKKGAPPPRARKGETIRKKLVTVDGKKFWETYRDIPSKRARPASMADWLEKATPATQAQVLGSQRRAAWFRKLAADRDVGAQAALVKVTAAPRNRPSVVARRRWPTGGMRRSTRADQGAQVRRLAPIR